jgi:hypothetical protein
MFKYKLLFYTVIILLSSCATTTEHENIERLAEVVNQLSEETYVSGSRWSYSENDANHPYCYLIDSTSIDDLVLLTNHESAIVRYYSFIALSFRRYDKIDAIVLDHIDDTSEFMHSGGCVVYHISIADFMLDFGLGTLDQHQRDSLRDAIIFHHPNLETFDDIARTSEGHLPYYDHFKTLAQQEFRLSIIKAIASYQKEEDVHYLSTIMDSATDYQKHVIIQTFPHEHFKHHLEEKFIDVEQDSAYVPYEDYYFAIAAYQNNWAKTTLNKLIDTPRSTEYRNEQQLKYIMHATQKFDSLYYHDIRTTALQKLNGDRFGTRYFDFGFNVWWR